MEDLNQFVPNVHFEKIPIKNLVSNQKYQRNLSQSHIARAAANFDLYQINPVKRKTVTFLPLPSAVLSHSRRRVSPQRCPVWLH